MKVFRGLALLGLLSCLQAETVPETTIAVGIFSRQPARTVRIDSPSHSVIFGGRPVLGPAEISWVRQDVVSIRFAGGDQHRRKKIVFSSSDAQGLSVTHPALGTRNYSGKVIIIAGPESLSLIELLDFEEYLQPVVAKEMMDCVYGLEDLKAQAVACRTFALSYKGRHNQSNFDFCDTVHCQIYWGSSVSNTLATEAVRLTRGKILTFEGNPARTYFHSTCGGRSASVSDVWGGEPQGYLVSQKDGGGEAIFCKRSPYSVWQSTISKAQLEGALKDAGVMAADDKFKDVFIEGYDGSHRVARVTVEGKERRLLSGTRFQTILGRALGWNILRSTKFVLSMKKGVVSFAGNGMGHGVGLCQWGASGMARLGYAYQDILKHYYPNTKIMVIKDRNRLLKTAYKP